MRLNGYGVECEWEKLGDTPFHTSGKETRTHAMFILYHDMQQVFTLITSVNNWCLLIKRYKKLNEAFSNLIWRHGKSAKMGYSPPHSGNVYGTILIFVNI